MGYEATPAADPYSYPGSAVLINLPDFRDEFTLQNFELETAQFRQVALELKPIRGDFDLPHFQAIHRFLFQDVYSWAGQLRTTNIAKDQTFFCKPEFIESSGAFLFSQWNTERADWPENGQWVQWLAGFYADVNALHPFREGNGRARRVFFSQLVEKYGCRLDWSRASQDEMVHASIESFSARLQPLEGLLARCLTSGPDDSVELP